MKYLKYITLMLFAVLSAACEQLPTPYTDVTLEKQTAVAFDDNSATLEIVFNYTAATIQSVVACYSTNVNMSNEIECAMQNVGTLAYRVRLTGLQKNTTYYVRYKVANAVSSYIVVADQFTTQNPISATPKYVDLGLPSGIKWADRNVGASKPWDYGDYFAWGETEPKDIYDWTTYRWCNGSETTLTKYNTISWWGTVDKKTVLEAADDVAAVKWGGAWRMPTDAELTELRTACTWIWGIQNGVNGYKVTGKNGNSIFLPAAGYRQISSYQFAGDIGYYWSSSLQTGAPCEVWCVEFSSDVVRDTFNRRYNGQSVRPVYGAREEDTTNETYFSVSATKKVSFSKGNLQYHPADNEWRFAENQTDYIGNANSNISSSYNGWIDLFGWSTGATNFGVSTSEYSSDYSGSFVDWGRNKIGNDAPNTWRTLTKDEWEYLLNTRPNASSLKGVAQVNGVNGLILLPDNWTCPSGVIFKSGFHSNYGLNYYAAYQTFTAAEWSKLEASGAVFLPAAGDRDGSTVYDVQNHGNFWSATEGKGSLAYCLNFSSGGASMYYGYRFYGHAVRLVKDL